MLQRDTRGGFGLNRTQRNRFANLHISRLRRRLSDPRILIADTYVSNSRKLWMNLQMNYKIGVFNRIYLIYLSTYMIHEQHK